MSLQVYNFDDRTVSQKVFRVEVLSKAKVTYPICQGVLKRIFSKQICFTYQIEGFEITDEGFCILFRFVCWNTEGQRKRYVTFKNMPQDKIEEALEAHKNKTVDDFCGEFFKRLRRKAYDVRIDVKRVEVIENNQPEVISVSYSWRHYLKNFDTGASEPYEIIVHEGVGKFVKNGAPLA